MDSNGATFVRFPGTFITRVAFSRRNSLSKENKMPATNLIKAAFAVMVLSFAIPLTACEEKGPAEKAGESIDEGVKDTKRAIEDATD